VGDVVAYLAGTIGPRETTSHSFELAAVFVESQFTHADYRVRRQRFHVPGGLSNYAPVVEGDTFNLIATPPGFDASEPHVVVGAHLDTVPQAPGAVDNATGVGIVIELARLAALSPPRVPVVFIAFGAEEARSPYGGLHGSKFYVSSLDGAERKAIVGMVAIDRVGTSSRVPVCTASERSRDFAQRFLIAARRAGIPTISCTNASSDHVPFANAGMDAVRIGPDDFRQYHTRQDVPSVLVEAQAERAGNVIWNFLRSF
jgi:aminopeptidase S